MIAAREALKIILKAHGLTLYGDDLIRDINTGEKIGELLTVKYDDTGGLRYSIKMETTLDYIDLDLDINVKPS